MGGRAYFYYLTKSAPDPLFVYKTCNIKEIESIYVSVICISIYNPCAADALFVLRKEKPHS